MRRREFITLLGGAATWPATSRGQQQTQWRHVAIITGAVEDDLSISNIRHLRQALQDLGWSDSKNVRFSYGYAGGDPERAISAPGTEPSAGLIVLPSIPISAHYRKIIELTAGSRLPTIYPFDFMARQGGLVAYGVDLSDLFSRTASYVDRILKGEAPAELAVQAPVKFKLVINLKTAKALSLEVPPMLLARADEVIE